jgi:hypothetical protein
MASFVINKAEIARLKVFNDYCKKMEFISPIEAEQVFVAKKDKLYVYGKGQTAAQIDAVFDISNLVVKPTEKGHFTISAQNFITFLEKTKDEEIEVNFDDSSILIKGKTVKSTFKQSLIVAKEQGDIDELSKFIAETLKIDEFKTPIEVNITAYRDVITDLTSMTKLIDVNQQIEISSTEIRAADNLNILRLKTDKDAITKEGIFLHRDITNLFKSVDTFQISSDKKWFYFDIVNSGIKILFVPKATSWQFPSDDDLKDIVPVATKQIELEINTEEFYNALESFEGVFDSSSWRYKQLKFKTPVGFKKDSIIKLNYDNMTNEVLTDLPVKVVSSTDATENFEFILPTLHFKSIKNLLLQNPTFKFIYSSTELSSPNGAGCVLSNGQVSMVIAKMMKD